MQPGKTYSLTLFTRFAEMTDGVYQHFEFTTNNGPSGGLFEVSPKTGTEDTTEFNLLASNWVSDNPPLNYCFKYIRDNGEEKTIRGL